MNKLMVTLSVLLVASFAQAADTKVGFVDMPKAVQATAAGKKAKAELEAEFTKKKKDIEKKEAELKKMGDEIQKKKAVLSEDALGKKQAEFQGEMMKYREEVQKSQMDLQKKQGELTAPIVEKMKTVVAKIAKEKGYTLVMENNNGVLFSTPDSDLTEEVVKAVDKL
ncbi:OmpH family outer membrane protein [Bdellovibrio sp. HCB290]|uniref:OmpH family outer membrane protein n=1 Tax=Bdellovibrio sp. HCB290 TaxID=3394356 RepID=UPI0039B4BDD0